MPKKKQSSFILRDTYGSRMKFGTQRVTEVHSPRYFSPYATREAVRAAFQRLGEPFIWRSTALNYFIRSGQITHCSVWWPDSSVFRLGCHRFTLRQYFRIRRWALGGSK